MECSEFCKSLSCSILIRDSTPGSHNKAFRSVTSNASGSIQSSERTVMVTPWFLLCINNTYFLDHCIYGYFKADNDRGLQKHRRIFRQVSQYTLTSEQSSRNSVQPSFCPTSLKGSCSKNHQDHNQLQFEIDVVQCRLRITPL